jgi:sugar lactone lactonase YvrE
VTASSKFIGLTLLALAGGACGSDDNCSESGTACMWAGIGERGFNIENPEAHRLDSKLYFPEDVTFGPDGRAYIVDWNNHRIRRVEKDDSLKVVVGTDYEGDGSPEMEDRLPVCNPAGAPATTVAMNHMTDVEFGPDGKLYIAAWHNNKIRVFDPATDMVTTLAGNGYGYAGDNDVACQALFNQPKAIAFAPDGTLYTVDQRNVRIRVIEPGAGGLIRTMAGTGKLGNIGDGGLATDAQFGFETGTTPRPSGSLVLDGRTLYVADSANNRIRRINLDTGIVDCIAGASSQAGYSGDGGPALQATFNFPSDIELGPDGRLYVADRANHAVRAIDLGTGIVETVVGDGTKCDTASSTDKCPDHAPARQMRLNEPYGIAFDADGNLYVADTHNNRVLKVAR